MYEMSIKVFSGNKNWKVIDMIKREIISWYAFDEKNDEYFLRWKTFNEDIFYATYYSFLIVFFYTYRISKKNPNTFACTININDYDYACWWYY